MAWKKGSSGNPRGRPRGYTLREALRKRFLAVGTDERTLFDKWAEELIAQAEAGTIDAVSSQPKEPGAEVWLKSPEKCSSQPRSWL
jgi:hypothetical protein